MRVCEACGGPIKQGLAPWHWRCPSCGLEVSDLAPFIVERSGPDIDEDARELALRPIRDRNFDRLLKWALDHMRDSSNTNGVQPRLLEVGCAHGWFLEKASAHYDVLGIEPDEVVATRTLRRGLPVRRGYFPQVLGEDETFNLIVFNDVLEHIPDVVAALEQCVKHLSPGGRVIVNAPDRGGVFYRIGSIMARLGAPGSFNRLWQKGLPSPHLYYFDLGSMSRVAANAGLRVTAVTRLPSLTAKGLYSRIRCSGDVSRVKSIILAAAILPIIPLLNLLPTDISVWMLAPKAQD